MCCYFFCIAILPIQQNAGVLKKISVIQFKEDKQFKDVLTA